ncbi:hypothetical protein PV05_05647 [Exophiala xenobiotica]|uniref:Uncharacterized protein n=1 Tax=Exophiala xenobiotica TaxID=348802 RepID=A0A0D2D3Z3_9EURO|nr:uncharacterized protein PV05_05647 [Exophiala xenobiotica]KIW57042.1 hypothetical protein PV05_05647 [Exophiala xenobiotica]
MCSNPEDSSPTGLNSVPPPPMLSYQDGNGTLREIFVPASRYEEVLRLHEKQDWKALSQFSPWSDCPPPPQRHPDSMTYTPKGSEGDGKRRTIYLPQGTAERATLLFVHEDWAALENEFEIYIENEHARGVERMRKAREDQAASQR